MSEQENLPSTPNAVPPTYSGRNEASEFPSRPTVEEALVNDGHTAYRDLDAERREIAEMMDGEFWRLPEGESFSVGIITFDSATVDTLKRTSAADARYEIFARAMNGQETSPEQISQIVDTVNNFNDRYGPQMSPPMPPCPTADVPTPPVDVPLPPAPPPPPPIPTPPVDVTLQPTVDVTLQPTVPDFKKILGDGPEATAIANIGQMMQILHVEEVAPPRQVEDIRPQSPAELGAR